MFGLNQLDEMSRDQLYLVINRLKRKISCMNSDLIRFEIHLKKFHKYFDRFNETLGLKKELMGLIQDIELLNQLNGSRCWVTLEQVTKNGIEAAADTRIDTNIGCTADDSE